VSITSPGERREYLRVIVLWLLVLAGLFALQEYFS
jgi:hypothetical protein